MKLIKFLIIFLIFSFKFSYAYDAYLVLSFHMLMMPMILTIGNLILKR